MNQPGNYFYNGSQGGGNFSNGKSSFFDLDEHIAAMLAALIPLGLSWIGYVSYVAWAIPLAVYLMEKRSELVRLNAAQSLALSVLSVAAAIIRAGAGHMVKEGGALMVVPMGIIGLAMSMLQLACAVGLVLFAIYGYRRRIFEIPRFTDFVKGFINYRG